MGTIGITGGSGTGKSAAARIMAELGAGIVDADAVYRMLCESSRDMLERLDAEFDGVLTTEGALDRRKLSRIVFGDPAKLRRLNELTFPYIRAAVLDRLLEQSDKPITLLDAPTLFETGADSLCDDTIGVLAGTQIRIARIVSRDRISRKDAELRISAQPEDGFYIKRCGHILINNGTASDLRRDTEKLYKRLLKEKNRI